MPARFTEEDAARLQLGRRRGEVAEQPKPLGESEQSLANKIGCAICGETFAARSKTFRYCSDGCRVEAERRRGTRNNTGEGKGWAKGIEKVARRTCEICGERFWSPPCKTKKGHGRFCSNKCRGQYIGSNPAIFPQVSGRRGRGGRRADLDNLYVRSSWEANWARYLNFLKAHGQVRRWWYECDTFNFPVRRGTRFYTPDFKVEWRDETVSYFEIKGYMDQRSATALRRMALHHPEVSITVIDQSAYRAVARSVGSLIPNWECARGRELARTS